MRYYHAVVVAGPDSPSFRTPPGRLAALLAMEPSTPWNCREASSSPGWRLNVLYSMPKCFSRVFHLAWLCSRLWLLSLVCVAQRTTLRCSVIGKVDEYSTENKLTLYVVSASRCIFPEVSSISALLFSQPASCTGGVYLCKPAPPFFLTHARINQPPCSSI